MRLQPVSGLSRDVDPATVDCSQHGGAAPDGDIALPLLPPIADGLGRKFDRFGKGLDLSEGREDCFNVIHAETFIRKTDMPQASIYPKCVMPLEIPSWHNEKMDSPAFNLDLVREKMKEQGVTQARIAAVIGLTSQSAMSNILKGTRKVTADEAAKIYTYLGIAFAVAVPTVMTVPIIGITNAGAWREAIAMPIGVMPIPNRVAGPRSFAVEVAGDSMDKLIEDGGFIVVDPDRKELTPGACYLLQNGEHEATVKMYQRDPARFEPCSSNPSHIAFLAADEDFAVLGRVVWKGAPM